MNYDLDLQYLFNITYIYRKCLLTSHPLTVSSVLPGETLECFLG